MGKVIIITIKYPKSSKLGDVRAAIVWGSSILGYHQTRRDLWMFLPQTWYVLIHSHMYPLRIKRGNGKLVSWEMNLANGIMKIVDVPLICLTTGGDSKTKDI